MKRGFMFLEYEKQEKFNKLTKEHEINYELLVARDIRKGEAWEIAINEENLSRLMYFLEPCMLKEYCQRVGNYAFGW